MDLALWKCLSARSRPLKYTLGGSGPEYNCVMTVMRQWYRVCPLDTQAFDGRRLRGLTGVDSFSRVSPAMEVRRRDTGYDVVRTLERATLLGTYPGGLTPPDFIFSTRYRRTPSGNLLHLSLPQGSFSQPATSLAKYVNMASAPARFMHNRDSMTQFRSSTQPLCAAALSMLYSPLTW